MSKSTITGTVDGVSDYQKNDYFNIALDDSEQKDNWFIGDDSIRDLVDGGIEKGDDVRIEVDKNKGSITDIEVVGSGSEQSSGEAENYSDKDGQRKAQRSNHDNSSLQLNGKSQRILIQTSGKIAKDLTIDECQEKQDMSQGEKLEVFSKYVNGVYNVLHAQIKDKMGEKR